MVVNTKQVGSVYIQIGIPGRLFHRIIKGEFGAGWRGKFVRHGAQSGDWKHIKFARNIPANRISRLSLTP